MMSAPHGAAQRDPQRAGALRPLGVALLGLGSYSEQRLAPGLQLTTHCKLVGLVTGTPSKIPAWREKYAIEESHVYDYENLASIADDTEIDVVYVVTPTALHPRFAIAAANAGKHVWCEKPMARTASDCQAIIDACKQKGVSLSIGYRMQHEPNTQAVMSYAKTKPYGAIHTVEALAGNIGDPWDSWRKRSVMGGGAIYDMGVYTINAMRYSVGEEPIRVVRATQHFMGEVDETTEFELEFPNGVIAHGKTSVQRELNRLTVKCARGSYYLEPMQTYEGVVGATSDGIALNETIHHQQAKQMDNEALAILEGREPIVPGAEGQRDIRIVEAIISSAHTGKPVDLKRSAW